MIWTSSVRWRGGCEVGVVGRWGGEVEVGGGGDGVRWRWVGVGAVWVGWVRRGEVWM